MSLSRDDVDKVSLLARLRMSPAELDVMTSQLQQIVQYVEQLSELDTEDIAPLAHAVEVHNVFAADEVRPSLDRELALANAPDMFCAFGMTYSNQSVADMIALYGYSKARPRQANRNSPMPTNLPPLMFCVLKILKLYQFGWNGKRRPYDMN